MKIRFYEKIQYIDALLQIQPVGNIEYKKLIELISENALKKYFLRNLTQSHWFTQLYSNNHFDVLSKALINNQFLFEEQFYLCEYLQKIVEQYPIEITKIIKNARTDNPQILHRFIAIGLLLPPNYTAKLVTSIRFWILRKSLPSDFFAINLVKWLNYLVEGNEQDSALKLLKILTAFKVQIPNKLRNKKVDKLLGRERKKAIPIIEHYWFKEMLTKGIKSLFACKPFEVIDILSLSLEKAINIEYGYLIPPNDLSNIWRVAIEEHEQNFDHYDPKDALLTSLRDLINEVAKIDSTKTIIVINQYLSHKYSIFKRLAINALRENQNFYTYEIFNLIKNEELLSDYEIFHEYYLLLKEVFVKQDSSTQNFIINKIRSIENFNQQDNPEIQEKRKRYYWFERLHYFEPYLENENKLFYNSLNEEFGEETLKDSQLLHESSYGERSPLSVSKMENMRIEEIILYLKNFNGNRGINSASSEGLARVFGTVVKRNPQIYLNSDLDFILDLKPNYAYWVINQISDLWKESNYYNVNEILILFSRLMRYENIPLRFTDEWGSNFNGVKRRILESIQSAIKANQKDFPLEYKEAVWNIIEYLCFYEADPQDSLTENTGKDSLDSFTLSLNSVRGMAMHSLIDYALWYAFHTKNRHEGNHPNRLEGEERVLQLLESKLDKSLDGSLAVHSTFGFFIPYLAYLNFDWLKNNLNKIFPEQKEYWTVSWSGYFYTSSFYKDLFELLKPQFERAVVYFEQKVLLGSSGLGDIPEEKLGEHLIIAALNGMEDIKNKNSLIRRYFKIKNNPHIPHAIQFISNLARTEGIFKDSYDGRQPFWEQAEEIWKIRTNVAKKERKLNMPEPSESILDQEFSKYLVWVDFLPEDITLKRIESLLAESIQLNKRGWHLPDFIDYLNKQSVKYPVEAIKLFNLLMNTEAPPHFFHGKENEISGILVNAAESNNPNAKSLADKIMNRFGEIGNYYFKDLWMKYFLDKL
jgi:hypothetical protein